MHIIERRAFNLLQLILRNGTCSVEKAMKQMNCSERQVGYDISKINALMADYQIEPIKVSKGKFIITTEMKERIRNVQLNGRKYVASGESKVWLIGIMLFCTEIPLGLNNFMADFKASKNTILNDIKKLSLTAEQYKVELHYTRKLGYHFTGEPKDIRTLVLFSISKLKDNYLCRELISLAVGDEKYQQSYLAIETIIQEFLIRFNLPVISEYMVQSVYFISILPYHCRSLFYRTVTFTEHLWMTLPLYTAVEYLSRALLPHVTKDETEYMFILILSMTLGYEAYFQVYEQESLFISRLTKGLTSRFEAVTGIVFADRKRMEDNLLMHLQAAFFRLKCGIPVVNPALSQIKKDYGEIFSICRFVLDPFADYIDCYLPDDEVGYIAIHFLAMIETSEIDRIQRRAVIVCQNGLGSAVMLRNQLEKMFPEILFLNTYNMEEFYNLPQDSYDIIFSAADGITETAGKHLFITSPILTVDEKFSISEQVYSSVFGIRTAGVITADSILDIVSDYAHIFDKNGLTTALNNHLNKKSSMERKDGLPVIKDLLTRETIRFEAGVSDWKEAIRLGAKPLLDNGSIDENYIIAMIQNVEEHGPYIVICPHIAIPHAQSKAGVHKLGMSFLKLEKEVNVLNQEDKSVKVFITLAAVDNNTHLKALAQLSSLLGETEAREKLLNCRDCEEVLTLLDLVND